MSMSMQICSIGYIVKLLSPEKFPSSSRNSKLITLSKDFFILRNFETKPQKSLKN